MKLYVVFAVLCAVVCTEAYRVARDTEEVTSSTEAASTTSAPQECCYPKPPRARKMRKCCEIPISEIYPKFDADLHECKDKKHEAESDTASSTTAAPTPAEDEQEEEGADIENLVDSDSSAEGSDEEQSTKAPEKEKTGKSHHGKGNCHRRHGPKGKKCLKPTMEKHGWATNGTINWDAIARDTDGATTDNGKQWVAIIKAAVEACRNEPYLQPGYTPVKEEGKHKNGLGKHFLLERAAFRCVKNNAVMNCPNFPEDDTYCVALRDVHKRCGARKQPGRKPIKWCDHQRRNRKFKSLRRA